ncbi:MAG: hypothetical protein R6V46_13235 [Desulfatiglandaceae bacterium]
MRQKRKSHLWWWLLLLIVAVAGFVGYLVASKMEQAPRQPLIAKQLSSAETKALSGEPQPVAGEKIEQTGVASSGASESPASSVPLITETGEETHEEVETKTLPHDCSQLENNVLDFFRYLDGKPYVRNLKPEIDTYTRFKRILKKMAANPPIPAGEGQDSTIILQNIYHFYRILDRQDVGLMRLIVRNEKETLEISLDLIYQWLVSGDRCPNTNGLRPSTELVYRYAGFFINTTGGRAYLFRRPPDLRLLISYYCLLIVNEADKTRRNRFGIDIFPFIAPIRDEIERYRDFHLQRKYLNRLNLIERYYADKR